MTDQLAKKYGPDLKRTPLAMYAWGVLVFNILVMLWGVWVRATGASVGCGGQWPLCNGELIPRAPQMETVIVLIHRMTSGLALLLVVGLLVWVFLTYPKGHPARLGAGLSMIFIILEILIGAGLALFAWNVQDASAGRVISTSLHLLNTFLLICSITLAAWWITGGEPLSFRGYGSSLWIFIIGMIGILLVSVLGAIGARNDALPPEHFLVRLQAFHPFLAVLMGVYLGILSVVIAMFRVTPIIRYGTAAVAATVFLQLIAGLVDTLLQAPVWMQIVHLLLADAVWIAYSLMLAANFAESEVRQNVA